MTYKKTYLLLGAFLFSSVSFAQKKDLDNYIQNAPFKMPAIVLPTIPNHVVNVVDYGAIGDGKTLNTEAFAKAITALDKEGGGQLLVPKGNWITGPIEIKSNIDFHVDEGALVQFSSDISQFPMYETSPGKYDVVSPIWGNNLHDVSFTGKGIFDGAGGSWRPVKKMKVTNAQWDSLQNVGGVLSDDGKIWWPTAAAKNGEILSKSITKNKDATLADYQQLHDFLRPKMFTLSKVKNLLLDGPTFRNSPNFVINPRQITNLLIQNVIVYNPGWAQNGDGIDISASENVVIYRTKVNAGDDGICMKSSGFKEGKVGLQNVLIADCIVNEGHGGFVIGSNTDGGMKNIYVTNCVFEGTDNGIRVKSNSGRGGDVSNIYIENIAMPKIKNTAILFDTYYDDAPIGSTNKSRAAQHSGDKIPFFHEFHVTNVVCNDAKIAFQFRGLPEQPIQDLYFKNIVIKSSETITGEQAKNIVFDNVLINGGKNFEIPSSLKDAIIIK
ncbi:glycoside hydrolase family 28 protein [Rhizosphaericola mali]|uniref:Glycoside hydrolase family 28 protein n=1 Tax=Rhizosphaericola mali TaxID=2545455 RepID=A0A5P2G3U4_9BACT|nr:glycoside hydrolase family 28 protein [Rhizosphaericola mali]QES88799.1 glycoside hydrolase family 28 protein [Rhizosphaericola mali]